MQNINKNWNWIRLQHLRCSDTINLVVVTDQLTGVIRLLGRTRWNGRQVPSRNRRRCSYGTIGNGLGSRWWWKRGLNNIRRSFRPRWRSRSTAARWWRRYTTSRNWRKRAGCKRRRSFGGSIDCCEALIVVLTAAAPGATTT